MNNRFTASIIFILIILLAGYIVVDVALEKKVKPDMSGNELNTGPSDNWVIKRTFSPVLGQLNSIAVTNKSIIIGGEPYIASYDTSFNLSWKYTTQMPVTALAADYDKIYAASDGVIIVLNNRGEKIEEWGPFENNPMITSLSANEKFVAIADAANKKVLILDKEGVVKYMTTSSGEQFIIPSGYFDIALDNSNILYVANPGNRRIEKRSVDGSLISFFGKPGIESGEFCGCCNPAHFALIPGGFVTAEKGINRIKLLNTTGDFTEFVSSKNNFVPPLPLDIASTDGKLIYGANPADSKIYVFERK